MPLSTFELRIAKLQERGVIAGYVYAVHPAAYGMQRFNLLIFAKGLNPSLNAALHQYSQKNPHVTYLIECMGNWDYVMGVETENTADVTSVMHDLYDQFGEEITQIKMLAKFRDVKNGYFKSVPQ